MLKVIRGIGVFIGAIVGVLIIIIGVSLINHKIQLSKEDSLFIPSGKMVQVNGHKLHVYTEGNGNDTLVFMSGGGTSSPVLDFKSLYSLLSPNHKIAVVEKVGYGFSDSVDVDRDIDAILEETREALSKAGLEPPYILFPHSMSGIEALHWAGQYPEEIQGIVGLDMAVPQAYEDYKINHSMLKVGAFAANIGFTRLMPSVVNSSAAIKHGTLTEEEKDLYRTIFYRRTSTKPMLKEVKEIKSNAMKVQKNEMPDTPMLFFISNGEGTGWDKEEWVDFQTSYIKSTSSNKYIKLNCAHYVHDVEYETIAKESQKFIGGLNDEKKR